MVVTFNYTYAISAFHQDSCEFDSRRITEVNSVQPCVVTFVSDMLQLIGFLRVLLFPPATRYDCNFVESGIKHS